MIKLLSTLLFAVSTVVATAQEICDNGKDDDRDGLIDLKDPDCQCHWKSPENILLNPSFEQYKHCRTNPAFYYQNYDIVDPWRYGVKPSGGIDFYFNFSCPADASQLLFSSPGITVQDGKGLVEILEIGLPDVPENKTQKYYIAQCLQTPLLKEKKYTLTFYAGQFATNPHAFTVGIFGHSDCNAAPFGEQGTGNGCPANYGGWVLLGSSTRLNISGAWEQIKIDLTIPEDINVIEIGPDCSILADGIEFFLDNFQLAETKDFNLQNIKIKSGNTCAGGYVLAAPAFDNATYQWYKDSIALVGQKGLTYNVPDNNARGTYNVRIMKNEDCTVSEPLTLQLTELSQLTLPTDTFICKNDTLRLGLPLPGITYSWNGYNDSIVRIFNPGTYMITASDTLGCKKSFTVQAAFKECAACTIFVPNAFTPNSDGRNDVLKGSINCPVDEYQLQIYSRWGQKVFESSAVNKGWDGTFKGEKVPTGVFVYFVRFKNSSNEKAYKISKGSIILIR